MNGAPSFAEMRRRIEGYRRIAPQPLEDYRIGCIILEDPFFLPREGWIPAPADFHPNIVVRKAYDLTAEAGRGLWEQVLAARAPVVARGYDPATQVPGPVFGDPRLVPQRLGQGAFRVMVTDAYGRRCAVTGRKALPALQAVHIRPVRVGGLHCLDNGLLLRADVHALFDAGYLTVTPSYQIQVSRRLKDDSDKGSRTTRSMGGRFRFRRHGPLGRPLSFWNGTRTLCSGSRLEALVVPPIGGCGKHRLAAAPRATWAAGGDLCRNTRSCCSALALALRRACAHSLFELPSFRTRGGSRNKAGQG